MSNAKNDKAKKESELIKALALALGCLKAKVFDKAIIEDLDKVLKENMRLANEKV
jgi:hypothetical protein